jgi:hypothetical protein
MLQGCDASHYGGSAYHGVGGEAGIVMPTAKAMGKGDASSTDGEELEKLRAEVAELSVKVHAMTATV